MPLGNEQRQGECDQLWRETARPEDHGCVEPRPERFGSLTSNGSLGSWLETGEAGRRRARPPPPGGRERKCGLPIAKAHRPASTAGKSEKLAVGLKNSTVSSASRLQESQPELQAESSRTLKQLHESTPSFDCHPCETKCGGTQHLGYTGALLPSGPRPRDGFEVSTHE